MHGQTTLKHVFMSRMPLFILYCRIHVSIRLAPSSGRDIMQYRIVLWYYRSLHIRFFPYIL